MSVVQGDPEQAPAGESAASEHDRPRREPIEVVALTHPGRVRANNEDAVRWEEPTSALARARGALAVVCDGVGGHAAGEIASAVAVETIHRQYYRAPAGISPVHALAEAIRAANQAVWRSARAEPERAGMASTATAAVVCADEVFVGHVGDSRAYLIHDGTIAQITRDHSLVAEQVEAGVLSPAQARDHPQKHVISRALGLAPRVVVDVYVRELTPGDVVLLCSDGLSNVVHDAELASALVRTPLQAAAESLLELALSRGAPDNVSLVLLRAGPPEPQPYRATRRRLLPLLLATGGAAAAFVASAVLVAQVLGKRGPEPPPEPNPMPSHVVLATPAVQARPAAVLTPSPTPTPTPSDTPTLTPTPEPSATPPQVAAPVATAASPTVRPLPDGGSIPGGGLLPGDTRPQPDATNDTEDHHQ